MKKRSQIKDEYKWNLSDIYSSDELLMQDIERMKEFEPRLRSFRGKLGKPGRCLEFLQMNTELDKISEKVGVFISLQLAENLENTKYLELSSVVGDIEKKLSLATSFEETELLKYGEKYINKLIQDPRFVDYKLALLNFLRNAKHILPEQEEVLVTKALKSLGGYSDTFDNIDTLDLKFAKAKDGKNREIEVTQHNYSQLLESKDRILRKNAMVSMYSGYHSLSNTISSNYLGSVNSDWFLADAYKFGSTLEMSMFGSNLPKDIYFNLIDNVNHNLKYMHKFYDLKKKALKLKDFYSYDRLVPITKLNENISYEKSFDKVISALSIMGKDYVDRLQTARNSRWIDVYPCEKKEGGGFCCSMYTPHPYILLNTVEDSRSIYTLAHELGHAMHGVLSAENQTFENYDHTIFLAEIASTVNEVLLFKYLYNNAKTKAEKLSHIEKYISNIIATIYVQTMYSEFEYYAHDLVEKGLPISKDLLNKKYKELNVKYYGKGVKNIKEDIGEGWMRIPHFYRAYYVYKYATGMTSAINFASKIVAGDTEALDKYLTFLKSGSSDYSYNILKTAGVDLLTDEPYQVLFREINWALKEMENLIK